MKSRIKNEDSHSQENVLISSYYDIVKQMDRLHSQYLANETCTHLPSNLTTPKHVSCRPCEKVKSNKKLT